MRGTAIASIDPNSYSDRIFSASHYGPFEAIVRDGKLVNISAMIELDNRPTEMLMYGLQDRIYDKTRIAGPMIRKSCLEGWQTGDSKPELRGKEPLRPSGLGHRLQDRRQGHRPHRGEPRQQAIFSASYGGWGNAGLMRPNVLQGRLFNLIGGCTLTQGDWSASASQISLPRVIGDMEVYSAQTAWEVIRDNTEVDLSRFCSGQVLMLGGPLFEGHG